MTRLDILIACLTLVSLYFLWRIRQLRYWVNRRLELESALREVITVKVYLRREFFLEALKLSDEEIDGSPEIVTGIWLRISIWRAHYTGDITFYRGLGEERKCESIYEFPTSTSQFPMELAKCALFREIDDKKDGHFDYGPKSPEKLVVLLSHKAIIIRARDGRFEWGVSSGHCYKPSPSDFVIPIREDDLREYRDYYGQDDPDWLKMHGDSRYYERDGLWATWRIAAVYPQPLPFMIAYLDNTAVKPSDGGKAQGESAPLG